GSHTRLSYASDIVAPRVRRAVLDRVEREVVLVGDVRGDEPNPIVVPWAGGDIRRAVDRDRQDEAVVVVGVFADQVDPAGRANDQARVDAIVMLELIANGIHI